MIQAETEQYQYPEAIWIVWLPINNVRVRMEPSYNMQTFWDQLLLYFDCNGLSYCHIKERSALDEAEDLLYHNVSLFEAFSCVKL